MSENYHGVMNKCFVCSVLTKPSIHLLLQYIADNRTENNPWNGVNEWALKVQLLECDEHEMYISHKSIFAQLQYNKFESIVLQSPLIVFTRQCFSFIFCKYYLVNINDFL